MGSDVDNLPKDRAPTAESRKQEVRCHRSPGILVCGPCVWEQACRDQGISGQCDSSSHQGDFPDSFPGARPSAGSHLPAVLTAYLPLQPTAFLAISTTELSLLAATTSHRRCKCYRKGEEPAIQVDCVVREKKNHSGNRKDRLELYHSTFWLF